MNIVTISPNPPISKCPFSTVVLMHLSNKTNLHLDVVETQGHGSTLRGHTRHRQKTCSITHSLVRPPTHVAAKAPTTKLALQGRRSSEEEGRGGGGRASRPRRRSGRGRGRVLCSSVRPSVRSSVVPSPRLRSLSLSLPFPLAPQEDE